MVIVPPEYVTQKMKATFEGASAMLPDDVRNPVPKVTFVDAAFTSVQLNPLPIRLADGLIVTG